MWSRSESKSLFLPQEQGLVPQSVYVPPFVGLAQGQSIIEADDQGRRDSPSAYCLLFAFCLGGGRELTMITYRPINMPNNFMHIDV